MSAATPSPLPVSQARAPAQIPVFRPVSEARAPKQIPVPRPVSEVVELLPSGPEPQGLTAAVAYSLVHSLRLLGFVPPTLLALSLRPRKALMAIATYYMLRRTDEWNDAMHRFIRWGSSRKVRMFQASRRAYDPQKQYLVTNHPHGVLLCPMFNWLGREEVPSPTDKQHKGFSTNCRFLDGIIVNLCFAPAVQFYPLHGEMYRDKVTDAKSSTMKAILQRTQKANPPESVMCSPGGFSEAVYVDYSDRQEVSYIKGRLGFIKLAIEAGIDIIPTYSFGAQDMYKAWAWNRAGRAKKAQDLGLPMVAWWGRFGTNMPYFEDTVNVAMEPFPTSQYSLDELEQAHADYCSYLKACFDEYKVLCEKTKDKELIFCGREEPAAELPPPRSRL